MTGAPRVSVVMPMRDASAFLDAAIVSVLTQTYTDFEFIIVDDGSRDESVSRARNHAAADSRIAVIPQPSLGIVAALNLGIRQARGDLIARMDADDVAAPTRFAKQVALLTARPDVSVVGSFYTVIDNRGVPLRDMMLPAESDAIRRTLAIGNCIAHPSVMMRRDAILAAGFYRDDFPLCEDYDLWLRLSETSNLLNLPESLLFYREHPAQWSWRDLERRLESEAAVLRDAARRRGDVPIAGGGMRAAVRARAMLTARGAIGEGRRTAAVAALRVAARQGLMPPMEAARWLRLAWKAGLLRTGGRGPS
jgi:glycosyltransferase involved in cell wall biosynthesis